MKMPLSSKQGDHIDFFKEDIENKMRFEGQSSSKLCSQSPLQCQFFCSTYPLVGTYLALTIVPLIFFTVKKRTSKCNRVTVGLWHVEKTCSAS